MTVREQRECDNMIEGIMVDVYTSKLDKTKLEDLLKMIVESQDIKQSIEDFVEAEDIEYEQL